MANIMGELYKIFIKEKSFQKECKNLSKASKKAASTAAFRSFIW